MDRRSRCRAIGRARSRLECARDARDVRATRVRRNRRWRQADQGPRLRIPELRLRPHAARLDGTGSARNPRRGDSRGPRERGATRPRQRARHAVSHIILPLASRRDKETEVRWGIDDFKRRFGRDPVGFWLPETAVDRESLDVIAAAGIAFTVLAPHQVSRVPERGRPVKIALDGGRSIAVFAYDGGLSHDVAFGALLTDPNRWTDALNGTPAGAIRALAVDGETFGHH